MAIHTDGKDIARLEVDAAGLVEGKDYLVVPFTGSVTQLAVEPGDEVIAVGSPIDPALEGTQTFGRVSALRPDHESTILQHDAPISPGNSGGPLFLKRGKKIHWIGINTAVLLSGNSLGLALSSDDAVGGDYLWVDVTPSGAAKVVTEVLGIPATAAN
ncbi:MAG: hypothetical protein CMJ64_17640 [Planctomycetaceae bacterium]|nr:hypothetical protein [Planctomycetaceae bacterium]